MFSRLILAGAITSATLLCGPMTNEAEAGKYSWRAPRRAYNQFQRQARQFERQYQRNYRSYDRNYSRHHRQSHRSHGHYHSGYSQHYGSGIHFGSPRAGVYFRF